MLPCRVFCDIIIKMNRLKNLFIVSVKIIFFALISVIISFFTVTVLEIAAIVIFAHPTSLHNFDAGFLQLLNYILLALLSIFILNKFIKTFVSKPKSHS